MGCIKVSTERRGNIVIDATLYCKTEFVHRGKLLDSLSRALRDSMGRYLFPRKVKKVYLIDRDERWLKDSNGKCLIEKEKE